jgi:hypothetical protein
MTRSSPSAEKDVWPRLFVLFSAFFKWTPQEIGNMTLLQVWHYLEHIKDDDIIKILTG